MEKRKRKKVDPVKIQFYKLIVDKINKLIFMYYDYEGSEPFKFYDWKNEKIRKTINSRLKDGYTLQAFYKVLDNASTLYSENNEVDYYDGRIDESYCFEYFNPQILFNEYNLKRYLDLTNFIY